MKITAQVKTHVMNSNLSYIRYNGFFDNLVYLLNNVIATKIVRKYWVSPPSDLPREVLEGWGVKPITSLLFS